MENKIPENNNNNQLAHIFTLFLKVMLIGLLGIGILLFVIGSVITYSGVLSVFDNSVYPDELGYGPIFSKYELVWGLGIILLSGGVMYFGTKCSDKLKNN